MSLRSREMVCTICSETTIAKTLSCGHTFHVGCIDDWLNNNGTCPVCRRCCNISHTSSSNSSVTIECSVCLEGILCAKILPCGDTFHEPCVNPLLREMNHCPQCYMRFDLEEEIDMSLCTVCQEAVLDREETLPCGHTFHKLCVASWVKTENTCPECKISLDPDKWICSDEASSSKSNDSDSICVICENVVEQNRIILSCGHKCHSACSSSLKNCPFCLLPSTFSEENTSPGAAIVNDGSCCFCTEMIVDTGVTLKCGHTFHDTCLALEEEVITCPQCFPQRSPIQSDTSPSSSSLNHTTSCVFCAKRITDDEISLTCNHMFHKKCVAPWIREQKMCPVCLAPSEVPCSTMSAESSSTIRTDNQVTCLCCSTAIINDQVTLDCGHKFHKLCVISWQTGQKKCPECLLPCESLSDEEDVGPILESNSTISTSPLHQAEQLEVPADMNISLQPGCSNTQNDERADSPKSIPGNPNYPSNSVENINENKEQEDKNILVNDVESLPSNVLCDPSNSLEESQFLLEFPNDEVNDCNEQLDESSFELVSLPSTTDCSNGIQKKVTGSLSSEECSSDLNQDNMQSDKPIPTCSGRSSTLQNKAHRDAGSYVDKVNTDGEKYVDKNHTVKYKLMHVDEDRHVDEALAVTDSNAKAANKYADSHVNKAHTAVDSQVNEAQTTVDSQVNEAHIAVNSHVNEDHTNAKSETCLICFQTLGKDELTLPCKHKYHKSCMTLLLQQ